MESTMQQAPVANMDHMLSDPNASSSTAANFSPNPANPADKPRLTEQEKKHNHIISEQKRRQAIREGFDELADLTPGLQGQGRSEALVLQGATAYIRRLLAERFQLVQQARDGGLVATEWELDTDTMHIAAAHANAEEGKK